MTSLRTTIRSWERRSTKLSSFTGWKGAWGNPCLHFRLWLRLSNKMIDPRKKYPWKKMKILPVGQTSNMVWINPPRDGNELKYSP